MTQSLVAPVQLFCALTSLVVTAPQPLAPTVSRGKWVVEVALITTSTKTRQLVPSSFVYVELDFEPLLALPSKNGAVVISPVKKQKGRPVGSKNKPKVKNVQPKKIKVFFDGSKLRRKWSPRVMNYKIMDIVSVGIPGNTL